MIPVEEGELENNSAVMLQGSPVNKENPREVEMHPEGSQEPSTDRSEHQTGRRERLPEMSEWSAERRELQEGIVRMAVTKSKRVEQCYYLTQDELEINTWNPLYILIEFSFLPF